MKSKKNVLVPLSVFIVVVFVLTLFGQQKGPLWDTINALKGRVTELETNVSTLQTQLENANSNINEHESQIALLEERVDTLQANQSEILNKLNTHTHDYSELTGDLPSHTHDYSDITDAPEILTEAEIINLINEHEHALGHPDWDSGWLPITPGTAIRIDHNLGGNPDNYLVDFQFYFPAPTYLIHNIHIGGAVYAQQVGSNGLIYRTLGAHWSALDNESITIHLAEDEGAITDIRVRIWKYED